MEPTMLVLLPSKLWSHWSNKDHPSWWQLQNPVQQAKFKRERERTKNHKTKGHGTCFRLENKKQQSTSEFPPETTKQPLQGCQLPTSTYQPWSRDKHRHFSSRADHTSTVSTDQISDKRLTRPQHATTKKWGKPNQKEGKLISTQCRPRGQTHSCKNVLAQSEIPWSASNCF